MFSLTLIVVLGSMQAIYGMQIIYLGLAAINKIKKRNKYNNKYMGHTCPTNTRLHTSSLRFCQYNAI